MAPVLQHFCWKLVGFFPYLVGHVCCDNCSNINQVKKKTNL